MDWFEELTGFRETSYDETQARLLSDDARYRVGTLTMPTLAELRSRIALSDEGRTTVRCVTGEARAMHADRDLEGGLFQVASQFNLLEMTGPNVTPEDGVTRYVHDHTQGPACAVAAGAATIHRNYLVPVDGHIGQTRERQLDALAPLGAALAEHTARPVSELWTMRNGYALCSAPGLESITRVLADGALRDELRGLLAIGLHCDVEVTDVRESQPRLVSQAFCSALPVAYGEGRPALWEPFARLILDATYEATLLAAVERSRDGSNVVLLTRVGGGVFGNDDAWIDDAIVRALGVVRDAGLDVRLVSHGAVHPSFRAIAERYGT